MPKSPNPDIINKIYFRNIYSCQRKIYWYKVKVMETINAVWEHSYGEDCIPNFSANMEQPRHRWYEFKEGFSLTLLNVLYERPRRIINQLPSLFWIPFPAPEQVHSQHCKVVVML